MRSATRTASHQPPPRRRRLLEPTIAAVAVVGLVLVGCTDDDDGGTAPDPDGDEQTSTDPEPDDDTGADTGADDGVDDNETDAGDDAADQEQVDVPPPASTVEFFPLDELLTEYEVRVGEIIIEFDGEVTDEGTLLTLEEPILFEFDSDVLKDTARTALDDIAEVLEHYADAPIEVIGHTDDQGSADYNLDLSERRADAVVTGLTDRGIDTGRITAEGRGLTEPVASNDTDEGRARNRRVEVLIVGVEPPEANE